MNFWAAPLRKQGNQGHPQHEPATQNRLRFVRSAHTTRARPTTTGTSAKALSWTGAKTSGSWDALAGPNLRYAASPTRKTKSGEAIATASVTPVPKRCAGIRATAGTSASESATE
jgi:hypothetical protein